MFHSVVTKQFKKEVKLARKRGKNLDKLKAVIQLLLESKKLPPKNFDHALRGNYVGRRECHLEPDWLLVYRFNGDEIIFERTGSHADLFR